MYDKQKPKNGKRKALIITNHPHALNATFEGNDYHRQGKWLKEQFGNDNVKIVMLNWAEYTNMNKQLTPLAKHLRREMTKEERHLWYDCLKQLPEAKRLHSSSLFQRRRES